MKYITVFSIIVLLSLTLVNYNTNIKHSTKIEECNSLNMELNSLAENFLFSLLHSSMNHFNSNYFLLNDSTGNGMRLKWPCLIYVFSEEECSTCVEENIFNFIDLSMKNDSIYFYIITTNKNSNILNRLSRIHSHERLLFGYNLSDENIVGSYYFLINHDGQSTNSYFPIKGSFQNTKRYLESAINYCMLR